MAVILVSPQTIQAPNVPTIESLIITNGNSVVGLTSTISPSHFYSLGVVGDYYDKVDILLDLELAAQKNGISIKRFINLAFCEASLNHNQWGDLYLKYPVYGIFQFQERTFNQYCEGEWKNQNDQIECAARLIKEGKKYLWSCKF